MTASAAGREATAPRERGDGLVGLDLGAAAVVRRARAYAELLAGDGELGPIALRAREQGGERLRRRGVTLYAPIYLSNVCVSGCSYCELHAERGHRIARRRLEPDEAAGEAALLAATGICNLLLVTGDDPTLFRQGYLRRCLDVLERPGRTLMLELPPQPTEVYRALVRRCLGCFVHYQECYHPQRYAEVHRRGPKRSYARRLAAPARAALAGAARVGIGALIGLGEPAFELAALVEHVALLRRRFEGLAVSVSVPRLRAGPADFAVPHPVDDAVFRRMVTVLSAELPVEIDLVLSTRESPAMRDELVDLGFTWMSAASSTAPGGYGGAPRPGTAQFALHDARSVAEVADMLRARGLEVR